MKIKLAIVFMLVLALTIGAVSAADDEITDNTDIILVSDNPTDDITDDPGVTDDGTMDDTGTDDGTMDDTGTDDGTMDDTGTDEGSMDDTSVIDDEGNLYDPIYTIQYETGVEENSDETGSSDEKNLISPAAGNNNTGSTNNTVPMQTTGVPILPLALATLLTAGGVISTKLRK